MSRKTLKQQLYEVAEMLADLHPSQKNLKTLEEYQNEKEKREFLYKEFDNFFVELETTKSSYIKKVTKEDIIDFIIHANYRWITEKYWKE